MNTKRIHYLSGMILAVFIGLHLFNHALSLRGAEAHIDTMKTLRLLYRHPLIETVLLSAVLVQVLSGLKLFRSGATLPASGFERLQRWSGLYLAFFFIFHVGAVLTGRWLLHLDTNFYFGVAGLNTFPFSLFFIPYYGFAVLAFFGHVAAIHHKKMRQNLFALSPKAQSLVILAAGLILTLLLLYGLTNRFQGVDIPPAYGILTGQ